MSSAMARPAGATAFALKPSTSTRPMSAVGAQATEAPPLAKRFLRPHLLDLAAYTPIEPFDVLSK